MKPLPLQFTESGWEFMQLHRKDDVAVYRKQRIGGKAVSFETIIIQRHNGLTFPGRDEPTPPAEFYPSSKQWGSLGWSFTDEESAITKMKAELVPF